MLDRDFAIVCDRGCDLPPLYIERTQATLVGAVAQTLGTPLSADELTQEFVDAYRGLARKGREVELKPKTLVIDEIELLACELPDIRIRVVCSKGTYIRALARDIGIALHSGAHLTALERTRVGDVRLEDCLALDQVEAWVDAQELTPSVND